MRHYMIILILVSVFVCLSATTVISQEHVRGIGLSIGEPTGISGKLWKNDNTAFAGAVAWSFSQEARIHVHVDWLTHNWSFLKENTDITEGDLPLYYGIGGRVKLGDDTRVGVRFVLGAAYIFETAPYDIFIEIAPIMDITPNTDLNGNGAVGVRYWF